MSILVRLGAIGILALGAVNCGDQRFQQEAYFKNDGSDRIFVFAIEPGVDANDARSHAEGLMNTSGRMTAAYYFDRGASLPRDGVTLARDLVAANAALYDTPGLSSWRFAYVKRGQDVLFADCRSRPTDSLCRR